MKRIHFIPLLVLLLASLACGGIGLAYEADLTADYAVWAPDVLEQAAVVRKDEQGSGAAVIIPAMVFAYGWNNDFIIAQRHPTGDSFDDVDEDVIEWYLLVVASGEVYGPLREAEYQQRCRELGVPLTLDFSQTIAP